MPEPDVIPMSSLSLSAAQRLAEAAISAARSHGVAVCVAVTDPSGEPIVTMRMDEAPRLSAEIARNKAYTVASFNGLPTHLWWPVIADDPALVHGITQTPRLVIFGGGVPVLVNGAVVGAVGVSGGSSEQDRAIAEAAAAAISPSHEISG
ncbi:MAG: heme-binding protein [Actinomycetota bacterium]|nr:heme-binding protein [Actinomycetota bacterium]